ncbi:AAA domain [Carpediemonas membranifera]|uniref:AAA domain n=1 Tax=Carpediemonas membranifera TaxID=201153 RepID=A0A8J6B992_9EUKA|nr:AAA domain [Carpediemonas membranifera]|eukprot:KAG9396859.1 AAA domain [Carpediemonas membranifera]
MRNSRSSRRFKPYDLVNIKVKLRDHKYVLSRFLIARQLTQTLIPSTAATTIANHLKKQLVDTRKVSITQHELEQYLFDMMREYGFGRLFADRFLVLTAFHQSRTPLVIFIAGINGIGKSFLATQLAERLNLPHVVQTNTVLALMEELEMIRGPSNQQIVQDTLPVDTVVVSDDQGVAMLVEQPDRTDMADLTDFRKDCARVRASLADDIRKTLAEGKPIIFEGPHIDPDLYTDLIDHSDAAVAFFVLHIDPDRYQQLADRLPSTLDSIHTSGTAIAVQDRLERAARRMMLPLISLDERRDSEILDEMHVHVLKQIEHAVGRKLVSR